MIKGIDISHWQSDAGPIDWKKVRGAGYQFCFMKSTEGINFKDPGYLKNLAGAREAGILPAHYHFAANGDPIKEADFFLSVIGKPALGEPVILDWEVLNSDPVAWCKKWLNHVEEKLGFKPIIYLNEFTVVKYDWTPVAQGSYGLWEAKYGNNDTNPDPSETPNTDEWGFYVVWQYSSRGTVPGINGNVDLNIASFDSIETLKKYGSQPEENEPKSKVIKELRDALEFAHNMDIGESISKKDQESMAKKLTELKNSEIDATQRLSQIAEIVKKYNK